MREQAPWRPAVHRAMGEEVLGVQVKVVFWKGEHYADASVLWPVHSSVFIASNL